MGRSVLITGTSTGIGRACAERMSDEGWTVYAGVRKESDGETLKASTGGDVRPVLLDVTNVDHISSVMGRLRKDLGSVGLDGLVNNAGVAEGGPLETLTEQDWRWHFDVNVFGVINLTRECLDLLRLAQGRVVNIGSIAGRTAAPLMGPYSAGKFAIEAISESLRFEVEDFGMKVACVEPGEIKTEIWTKSHEQLARIAVAMDSKTSDRYERHLDMLYGFVAEGTKKGIPSSKVADVVYHALTATRPRHRYLVGVDAKIGGFASRLPDPLRYRVLSANFSRWARAGHKIRSAKLS